MTRWSARYKSILTVDTMDTVDTVGCVAASPVHCVNSVNSVTPLYKSLSTCCAWCGVGSPPFSVIVNIDLWLCSACLPGDPDEQAMQATERAAIIGEGTTGDANAPIPHAVPPSWADSSLQPTPGARCRLCDGSRWWCETERPKGWRCWQCHPGDHLPSYAIRECRT